MLKLLTYLLAQKKATLSDVCPPLEASARGLPALTEEACTGTGCNACAKLCPTDAIAVVDEKTDSGSAKVAIDLGACIGCGLCFQNCPTGTIAQNLSTRNARRKREELVLKNDEVAVLPEANTGNGSHNPFKYSLHARVVSTGCSACDLEIAASGNPIFDIERFGVHIVASPRFADALIVTGPVGKGMQTALKRCYEAMAEPRVVIAAGTCAISGGVHRNGYTDAQGADNVLPVDVYIPGCPPQPWQLVYGVLLAMGRQSCLKPEEDVILCHPTQPTPHPFPTQSR
ncbi:MAG: NADH-quinone oxidoreductase subunit NuoB [Candidatus Melainabacteria bacterium]|nr:NADH-quinone oxidoreductase subunit NuoB [Candidatus Melainabacteria bacterium]